MKSLTLWLAAAATLAAGPLHASTIVERELHFDRTQVRLVAHGGLTDVTIARGSPELRAGRPDLPSVSERLVLPPGQRVSALEVLGFESELLSSAVRVAPAYRIRSDVPPDDRTEVDPVFYGRAGFQPEQLVELGLQGSERGTNVAYLITHPVRWNASSGALEFVRTLRVRLTLEPASGGDLAPRERIVREWEDALPSGVPTRALAASLAPTGQPLRGFKATQLPSTLGSPVAYVIVTSDALAPMFQRLADWKTQAGVPAVVRTVSFIRQQYPAGADDADRVRQFIRDAYSRWGTKWVLLGGDTDIIPTRLAYTKYYGGEFIATDLYFSCVDGNWNADGDSLYGEGYQTASIPGDAADLMPDVYVGRAPVSDTTQASQFVNKTLQYTCAPAGDYEKQLLFFAEVLFPQDWTSGTTSLDGAELVEEDLPSIQSNPSLHFARLYQNDTDSRWLPGSLPETRQRVLDSLNVGYNVVNHVGHGYRNVMSVGDANLTNSDALSLTNGNRLMNLYAANCTSNAIDYPCIGEAFLHALNGGAVTNVGSSRFDFPVSGRNYQKEYFRLLYRDSVSAIGELQARQKLPFLGPSGMDFGDRWTQMTMLLLGDPELHIWTGTPRTLTVVRPSTIVLSDTTINVNVKIGVAPLYHARVTAYKAGEVYASALTDGAGDVTLALHPDTAGPLSVTVTAYDCRPSQSSVLVSAASAAVLTEQSVTVDDNSLSGTVGNDDGVPDAGETIDLTIPIKNAGGDPAPAVTGALTTTDPLVSIGNPAATYGAISGGAQASGTPYRLQFPPDLPDQREVPLTLSLVDGNGGHDLQQLQITVHAPEPRHFAHVITEVSGNGNGRPELGETVDDQVILKNLGSGVATGVTAVLRNYDGKATITDSTASFGVIAPGAGATGDAFRFSVTSANPVFELRVSNTYALIYKQTVDVQWPAPPSALALIGGATTINLTWKHNAEPDLIGYNIYRALSASGPFTRVNAVPTDRTSYYLAEGLAPLTRYYFKVSAVDSSGNESSTTVAQNETTTLPNHGVFPIATGGNTSAPVAVARLYAPGKMDIVAGSNVLYVLHADGSAPVDADGDVVGSQGDFTTLGSNYASGASIGDLDGNGLEIIGPTWADHRVYVFDLAGNLKPGWPFDTGAPIWSSAAIGDVDGDGKREMFFGSSDNRLFGLRWNGTEVIDGDSNPLTPGVFKTLPGGSNFGSPALADLDGDGLPDIVYASFSGTVYAWKGSGASLPGFPITIGGDMSMSPAVGFLDGAGDLSPEIVLMSAGGGHDSLYVFGANGARRAGFPKYLVTGGTSKQPSPALADMDNDGFLDIVVATTTGLIQVFDRNGNLLPKFAGSRYSKLNSAASESSPAVADIDGDGTPDVVMGDENTELAAIGGATGLMMPGFPMRLGGEVRGAPALCDCDGDGMTEIVLTGWDANIYEWDYDFPFNPNGLPAWPQFHHDAMRTGFASGPTLVDVPPGTPTLPSAIEFAAGAPNPMRASTRVRWGVPSLRAGEPFDLSVYDLTGRHVTTLASGHTTVGRFSSEWSRRAADGTPVKSGVYFVRLQIGATVRANKLIVLP